MIPSRRTIGIAVAGFVLALLPVVVDGRLWTVWPIFVAWLVAAVGLDVVLSPPRSAIDCRVDAPATLHIGSFDRARLTLRLPTRRQRPLDLVVDLSEELQPLQRIHAVGTEQGTEVELPLRPRRRGTASIEAVWVRYTGPLGLIVSVVRIPIDREVAVVPSPWPARPTAIRFFADRDSRAGLKVERFKGDGTEFDSLEEFVRGDDPRAIDWKASARHRKLLARHFRAERNHQVILAVDTGHLMAESLEGIPKLDHALNVALSLAYVCLRTGDQVGLYTFDSRVGLFVEPRGGAAAQARMAHSATRVAYSHTETNFTLALTALAQRVRRRSLVVVLTDFADSITAELMIENLQRLSRRHLVLFVALNDPALERIAAGRPGDTIALNRTVVAETFVREREVVMRRLRRLGILAVDSAPGRVHADLINSYLDVKRKELV